MAIDGVDGVAGIHGGSPILPFANPLPCPDFQLEKSPSFRPGPFGLGLGKPWQRDCNNVNAWLQGGKVYHPQSVDSVGEIHSGELFAHQSFHDILVQKLPSICG